jgi:RND family efflux transporter MFP subunit
MRAPIALISMILIATSAGMNGCAKKAPSEPPPLPVTVQPAQPVQGKTEIRYSAALMADKQLGLSFKSPGFVTSILHVPGPDGVPREVQTGDKVQKGTVLAAVRASEYEDQVEQARANFMQAKADYERSSSLFEQNVISKADYDAALAKYRTAQATLKVQLTALSDTRLRAPMDGTVIRRNIEIGSLVSSQTEAFTFASTQKVKVVFGVPDVQVLNFKLGQAIAVHLDAFPQKEFNGKITRIGASADPTTRMFDVEVSLDNRGDELREGMIASLEAPGSSSQMAGTAAFTRSVEVPLNSVVRPKGDPNAFAVYVAKKTGNDYRAEERRVRIGQIQGKRIIVLEGVAPGEPVVEAGSNMLSNNQKIQIIQKAG